MPEDWRLSSSAAVIFAFVRSVRNKGGKREPKKPLGDGGCGMGVGGCGMWDVGCGM